MKLYKVKDQVQDIVDCANSLDDILVVGEITKNILICPKNQSIPERMFDDIDCEVATTKRKAYLIGLAPGDIVINYTGENRIDFTRKVVDYCVSCNPSLEDKGFALRDSDGKKGVVYAHIPGGVEFGFYGGDNFSCNYLEFDSINENKTNSHVTIDGLVGFLSQEFSTVFESELPKSRNNIKNNRGIIKSCNTGKTIFELKKKIYKIRCPMVFDDGGWKPQVLICGFSGINNTSFDDGFVTGDIEVYLQDDEEVIKKLLEEKGGVEWVG